MRRIVYYVATSLDGFISGPDGDVSRFANEGNGVTKYLADLADYDTVIMGRKTYEFGYKFGLKPGELAYRHMTHYIFSSSLSLENADPKIHISPMRIEEIEKIKKQRGTDVYLCGGGQLAGWLLDNNQIDVLKIKLNPLILGAGVPIFGKSTKDLKLKLTETGKWDNGLQIMTYELR